MQAKVFLAPEPGFRHFGKLDSRTIELMPSFCTSRWWTRYQDRNGDRKSFYESMGAPYLSNVFEEEGYDLRACTWVESEARIYPYNPFFPKSVTAEMCTNVYFALSSRTGLIKIGYSGNHIFRLKGLSVQLDTQFTLLGLIEGLRLTEQDIHKLLKEYNVEGEWFQACEPVRQFIATNTYLP